MANTKGDLFEGIMWAEGLALQRKEPAQIADYPEHVIETLRTFYRLWKPPERAIPSKQLRGQFQRWVMGLDELNNLAGDKIHVALQKAFERYEAMSQKFIVSNPSAVKKLVIDVLSQMNREEESKTKTQVKKEVEQAPASKNELLDMLRELKNL